MINKKDPIFSFDHEVGEGDTKKTFRIQLKRPTRSMSSEADMFYSIQLNRYIKMGLLTAEQLAKRQIDIGGTFSEEQQRHYANLQALIAEKEEMFMRLMEKEVEALTPDEKERKDTLYKDLSMLRTQIMDYEYIRNQVYEHTANSKARNDVILWWVLALSESASLEKKKDADGKETEELGEFAPIFGGETHESRKLKLDEYEDAEDRLVSSIFVKMAKIVTLWYWMGISDKDRLKEAIEAEQKT